MVVLQACLRSRKSPCEVWDIVSDFHDVAPVRNSPQVANAGDPDETVLID